MGISFDTAAENSAFAEAQSFGYPLLCDEDRTVGLAYKACDSADAGYPRRITYVIAGDGTIEHAIDTQDPAGQAADILGKLG